MTWGTDGRPVPSSVARGAFGPPVHVSGLRRDVAGACVSVTTTVSPGVVGPAVRVAGLRTSVPLGTVNVAFDVAAGVVGPNVCVRGHRTSVARRRHNVTVPAAVHLLVVGPSVTVCGQRPSVAGTPGVRVPLSVARGVASRTVTVRGHRPSVTGTPTVPVESAVSPGVMTGPVGRPHPCPPQSPESRRASGNGTQGKEFLFPATRVGGSRPLSGSLVGRRTGPVVSEGRGETGCLLGIGNHPPSRTVKCKVLCESLGLTRPLNGSRTVAPTTRKEVRTRRDGST